MPADVKLRSDRLVRQSVGTPQDHAATLRQRARHKMAPSQALAQLPHVRERIAAVRAFRQGSKRKSPLQLADTPTLWQVTVIPEDYMSGARFCLWVCWAGE